MTSGSYSVKSLNVSGAMMTKVAYLKKILADGNFFEAVH